MGLVETLKSLKGFVMARFRGRKQSPSQVQSDLRYFPPVILTGQKLSEIVNSLDHERIRRTIMLFDIRWLKEDNTSYIPEEEQIAKEAYSACVKAVVHGRVLGVAEVRDKGFIATYARINNSEVLNLRYVLAESSSLD